MLELDIMMHFLFPYTHLPLSLIKHIMATVVHCPDSPSGVRLCLSCLLRYSLLRVLYELFYSIV